MVDPQDILEFWFGPSTAPDYPQSRNDIWWRKSEAVDAEIKSRFAAALEAASSGALDHWRDDKSGRLALIILVDQMSRNMHRGDAAMFATDDLGQELALLSAISDDYYTHYVERMFQYMPLMHAENVALQRLCVHLFTREVDMGSGAQKEAAADNLDFARRHLVIIERFGRFPHRNEILGRTSTDAEAAFLKEPGSSF